MKEIDLKLQLICPQTASETLILLINPVTLGVYSLLWQKRERLLMRGKISPMLQVSF